MPGKFEKGYVPWNKGLSYKINKNKLQEEVARIEGKKEPMATSTGTWTVIVITKLAGAPPSGFFKVTVIDGFETEDLAKYARSRFSSVGDLGVTAWTTHFNKANT